MNSARVEPGRKGCRASGVYNGKGIISMKTRIANLSGLRHENQALIPFGPRAKGQVKKNDSALRTLSQVECWSRRNVAINVVGSLVVVALAAFIGGYYKLSAPCAAFVGLLLGGGVTSILVNLFPLKTWEVRNVRRSKT